jgi:predicted permease
MRWLRQDVRFALGTGRGRIVSVLAVASLALVMAGNAVAFSTMEAFVLRPLPYPDADRLVLLGERQEQAPAISLASLIASYAIWAEYRDRSVTLRDWAAFSPRRVSQAATEGAVPVTAARVTGTFFELLGARAVLGRLPQPAEMRDDGARIVVLSWEYWQERIGADRDPLGMALRLDGETYEVVGVLAPGFEFLMSGIELWLPLHGDPRAAPRGERSVVTVARMAPGTTMAAVKAEIADIARQIQAEYPETHRGWTADAMNLRTEFPDSKSRLYMALMQAAVFLVLLIACANIINLLLVRAQDRRHEIALRTTFGASRFSIVAQLTRESMILAGLGAALGLGLAALAIRVIAGQLGTVLARTYEPALSTGVLLFTGALAVLCGVLFGVAPALQALKQDQASVLRQGTAGGGRGSRRFSTLLVAGEVAVCLVALGAGGVLARSFVLERGRDPGYTAKEVLAAQIVLPHWRHTGNAEAMALLRQLQERLAALPRVLAVSIATVPPQALFPAADTFRVAGHAAEYGAAVPRAISVRTSSGYLETLQVPLVEGRFFDAGDDGAGTAIAIVSRTLAERRFPGRTAVGEHLTMSGETRRIVGVAGDVRQSVVAAGNAFEETIYTPLADRPPRIAYLLLRVEGEPLALAAAVRQEVRAVDADITIHTMETLQQHAGRYLVGLDIFNVILTTFGAFALLLASLGIYGLVAFSVRQRSHEIGVRMAVGAAPWAVVRMMTLQGARVACAGLLVGSALLVPVLGLVGRVLAGFGLAPLQPAAVAAIGALLLGAALAASALPALRAARIEPLRVLRAD